jgi:hypothetical protein
MTSQSPIADFARWGGAEQDYERTIVQASYGWWETWRDPVAFGRIQRIEKVLRSGACFICQTARPCKSHSEVIL